MLSLSNFARVLAGRASRRIGLAASGLAAVLLLAACGGSEAPGAVAPTTPVPKLAVVLTDASGTAQNTLDRSSPLTVTATLVAANGQPVANSLVQLELTFPGTSTSAVLSNSSGITDSSGRFSAKLYAADSTSQGGGTVTATAVNVTDVTPATASFQVVTSTPPVTAPALSLTLTKSGTAGSTLTTGEPLTATATLRDGSNRPVANSLVQFTTAFPGGSPLAVLSPSSGSGYTDAEGKVAVTLFAASQTAQGSGSITATAVNLTGATPVTTPFQVVASTPPVTAPVLALALSSNTLSRDKPLTATAKLVDGKGVPVANSLIQFKAEFVGGSSLAVLSPSSGSGFTDAKGEFGVTLVAANPSGQGSGTVTATAVNLTDAAPAKASFQVVATTSPPVAPVVTLKLTDPASGAARSTLTFSSPLKATAKLVDGTGRVVANSLVQFSLTTAGGGAPVAVFSPASGNGITDEKGELSVTLQAAALTAQGAGTVTATAVNETGAPSATVSYQVGATPISLGNVTRTPAEIEPLQTSTIKVQVSGVPPSIPVTVRFASPCATSGLATLPASVVTVNGVATAVYTDKGCKGTDSITISSDGATSIETSIRILPAPPVAIQFVSATPTDMSIFGVGGQPTSVVVFKAVNAAQQPVADQLVTLKLETDVFGVTLDGQGVTIAKRTAQDGTVSVTVVAGAQAGPVRVIATADGGLKAVSSLLTIHTGLPVQSRFGVSFQTFNIEGWNVDGTSTSVSIRAADRIGNPVPDGTTVNFRAAGAAIEPTCRTVNGTCSVTFRSQASRPANGRVAILAWAVGEENFFDTNGNNRYDAGEPFGDLGNAFVDSNLNGVFDSGSEEFIAYNPVGKGPCLPSSLSVAGVPDTCDGVFGLAHVRTGGQVVLSSSAPSPFVPLPSAITLRKFSAATCTGSLQFALPDVNGNPMPAGTTITAEISPAFAGDTVTVFGSPVVNTLSVTGVAVDVTVAGTASPDPAVTEVCRGDAERLLRITVKSPLGTTAVLPAVRVIY